MKGWMNGRLLCLRRKPFIFSTGIGHSFMMAKEELIPYAPSFPFGYLFPRQEKKVSTENVMVVTKNSSYNPEN